VRRKRSLILSYRIPSRSSSLHNAKGLDFDLVYLIGVDRIRPTEAMKAYLIPLVYVAMTRAKYRLVIPYVDETELIRRMEGCLPEPAGKRDSAA
jgi:superfamily I DNA/RNA helicase